MSHLTMKLNTNKKKLNKIIWWFIMWPSLGGCIKHCTMSVCLSCAT